MYNGPVFLISNVKDLRIINPPPQDYRDEDEDDDEEEEFEVDHYEILHDFDDFSNYPDD